MALSIIVVLLGAFRGYPHSSCPKYPRPLKDSEGSGAPEVLATLKRGGPECYKKPAVSAFQALQGFHRITCAHAPKDLKLKVTGQGNSLKQEIRLLLLFDIRAPSGPFRNVSVFRASGLPRVPSEVPPPRKKKGGVFRAT